MTFGRQVSVRLPYEPTEEEPPIMTIGFGDLLLLLVFAQGGAIPAPLCSPYIPVTAVSNPRGTVAALSKDWLEGIWVEREILQSIIVIDGLT